MCQAYRIQHEDDYVSAMPTNLYGIGDNFDLQSSHVLPALMRKVHLAKLRGHRGGHDLGGTGTPQREFMFVDDLADACVFLMKNYSEFDTINIGSGEEVSIRELATLIADVTGYGGEFVFDDTKPDGTPRKRLDVDKLAAPRLEGAYSPQRRAGDRL